MPSPLLAAFEDLLDAQEDANGTRLKASVGEVRNKDAIVEEMSFDDIAVAGGNAESGGFRLQMRKSDFSARPEQFEEVTAKGITLQLLTIAEAGEVYTFTAGDPVAED